MSTTIYWGIYTDTVYPSFLGEDHAFKRAAVKLYSDPLGEHKHENETLIATESSDGYEVYAQLVIYANVAGKPVEGETKI